MLTITEKRKREDQIADDRAAGLSWKKIGEKHGVASGTAMQIAKMREYRIKSCMMQGRANDDPFLNALTVRTRNCLAAEDLNCEEEVSLFIKINGIEGLMKLPNMGKHSAKEVLQAMGKKFQMPKPKPLSDGRIKGAITLLQRAGYKVEKIAP